MSAINALALRGPGVCLGPAAEGTPWLAIQPTLQRIASPGVNPALRDAWVAGARFEIAF